MAAQADFETLLHQENKLHEAVSLAEVASLPRERVDLVSGFLGASGSNRKILDALLLAMSAAPSCYRPVVARFAELRVLMLRREAAWMEILSGFDLDRQNLNLTVGAMNTVGVNCRLVDPVLEAIVQDLQALQAASTIEAFLVWAVQRPLVWTSPATPERTDGLADEMAAQAGVPKEELYLTAQALKPKCGPGSPLRDDLKKLAEGLKEGES